MYVDVTAVLRRMTHINTVEQTLGLEYTVGWERGNLGDYHVKVLLKMLTSNFAPNWYVCLAPILPSNCFSQLICSPELHDEVVHSLNLVLSLHGDGNVLPRLSIRFPE
jgi:hypothetical protein